MNKKIYEKPLANFLAFYSEKDITSEQNVNDYVGGDLSGGVSGGAGLGGEIEDGVE
jgi:hypothetical protein